METRFLDSFDGVKLRVVVTGSGPRDVLLLGGLAEHAGRYTHVADAFAAAGFTVTTMELRGHGHSGGRRSHVFRWSEYTGDLRSVAGTLRPGWALVAHSMGGLVSLDAVREGLRPRRLALSNPLLGVAVKVPGWKTALGKGLSGLWPTLALTNEIDPAGLSRDLEVGRRYQVDPLVYGKVTARWFTEMTAAQARVAESRPEVPVHFFLGDADPITSFPTAKAYAERLGAPLRIWPEMRHELFNELGKEEVIAEVVRWIAAD